MKLRNHKYADPIKALRQKGSYLEKMTGEAEQLDIKFFTRDNGLNIDNDYLSLPKDITSVPSRDLGRYMNAFTQQKVYMRTMENYAELVAEEARRNYVDVSAPYFSDMFGSKVSETAKEREVNSTVEVREAFDGGIRVFDCVIPNTVKVGESVYYGEPLCEYAPKSEACEAYMSLSRTLLEEAGLIL